MREHMDKRSVRSGISLIPFVGVAMTLRLTDEEQAALRARAAEEGISMQDAARRAVREYVSRGEHRRRVATAADRVKAAHAEALERLGQ